MFPLVLYTNWTYSVPEILSGGTFYAMDGGANTLYKYVGETRGFTFDFRFKQEIQEGDTIVTINSISALPSGLTISGMYIEGPGVLTQISGGTSGITYVVTCTATTADGSVLVAEGNLVIRS